MVLDLKAKKVVNGDQCFRIAGSNSQLRAPVSVLGVICDFTLQPLHLPYTRRRGSMNEHRDGKIALPKPTRDHRQVTTNSALGSGIRGLVALDFDRTAIGEKVKVMSWLNPIP